MINAEQVNQYFTEQAKISGVDIAELRRVKQCDTMEWGLIMYNFNLILHEERNKRAVYG